MRRGRRGEYRSGAANKLSSQIFITPIPLRQGIGVMKKERRCAKTNLYELKQADSSNVLLRNYFVATALG